MTAQNRENSQGIEEFHIDDEVVESVGEVEDISPKERAKLAMAYWILSGVILLLVLSWATLIFAPDNRQAVAQDFFDFTRAFGPPLVTLVLGYYFRDSQL